MSCPTCDHTMHAVGASVEGRAVFHCPRCGTLVGCSADGSGAVPALVGRCRKFRQEMRHDEDGHLINQWRFLGIREAINAPDHRDE